MLSDIRCQLPGKVGKPQPSVTRVEGGSVAGVPVCPQHPAQRPKKAACVQKSVNHYDVHGPCPIRAVWGERMGCWMIPPGPRLRKPDPPLKRAARPGAGLAAQNLGPDGGPPVCGGLPAWIMPLPTRAASEPGPGSLG